MESSTNKSQAIATHRVVPQRILLRVRDEQRSTYILNVKRREPASNVFRAFLVLFSFDLKRILAQVHALKIAVVNLDFR